jgi:hypothetical protein
VANSYAGLMQSLCASFNRASLAKEGRNVLSTMVVRDFEPTVASPFSTINTNIMASTGTPTNLASGDALTLSTLTINPGAVVLNQHPTYGFALPTFDYSRTPPGGLIDKLRDEAIKKIGNEINGYLASLITVGNFTSHNVTSAGANTITDAKMGEAWAKLANDDVPVGDLGNLFLATHPTVYSNLVQTAAWAQSAYVGDVKAGEIRSTARLGLQWGAIADFDPDMPTEVTADTFTSLLFHRNAIALVSRALAPPIDTSVPTTYVMYKGIPIMVTITWNNLTQSNEVVFSALYGASVVREDHGCTLEST